MSSVDMGATPLPKRILTFGILIKLFGIMTSTMVYSYLPQLIKSFHIPDKDIGLYAGPLSSGNFLGTMCTSFAWGMLGDRIGNKFTCMISATFVGIATMAFGFSLNYTWAITVRILQGALFAIHGSAKAFISENCDDSNIGLAFTLAVQSYSIGCLIGPIIGGCLSFPVQQHPKVFHDNKFLQHFPIFLPNLIGFVGLISIVCIGLLILPNGNSRTSDTSNEENKPLSEKVETTNKIDTSKTIDVIRNKWLIMACLAYGLTGILNIGPFELFPLYAATSPKYYGMGYSPSKIGFAISFAGLAGSVVQLVVIPMMLRKFTVKTVYLISLVSQAVLYPFMPMIGSIHISSVRLMLASIYLFIAHSLHGMAIVASSIVLTNCVPTSQYGKANGLGMTTGSLGNFGGALMAGTLYAWSLTNVEGIKENVHALGFPFNQYFTFIVFALVALLNSIIVATLPDRLNNSYKE